LAMQMDEATAAEPIDEAAIAMQIDEAAGGGAREAAASAMGDGGDAHDGGGVGGPVRRSRRGKSKLNGGVRQDLQRRARGGGE
jgi:hypothetical protein